MCIDYLPCVAFWIFSCCHLFWSQSLAHPLCQALTSQREWREDQAQAPCEPNQRCRPSEMPTSPASATAIQSLYCLMGRFSVRTAFGYGDPASLQLFGFHFSPIYWDARDLVLSVLFCFLMLFFFLLCVFIFSSPVILWSLIHKTNGL